MTGRLSISLIPHAYKNPISSSEFWASYPHLAQQVSEIFGGREKLEQIPVFPLEDLEGRFVNRCCTHHITHLQHPIEIYFDGDGKKAGVFITYKINIVEQSKVCCLANKVKRGIEMIHFLPRRIGPVFSEGGPASAKQAQVLPLLKKLFAEHSFDILPFLKKGDSYGVQLETN